MTHENMELILGKKKFYSEAQTEQKYAAWWFLIFIWPKMYKILIADVNQSGLYYSVT